MNALNEPLVLNLVIIEAVVYTAYICSDVLLHQEVMKESNLKKFHSK